MTNMRLVLVAALLGGCLTDGEDGDLEYGEAQSELTGCTAFAEGACDGLLDFKKNGRSYYLPYYRNYALSTSSSQIRHAVILVHGASRRPWNDLTALFEALQEEDDDNTAQDLHASTIVIAPHFIDCPAPSSDRLCWGSGIIEGDWPVGGLSDAGGADRFSSFEVADEVLRRVIDGRFPNLDRITFAGHSAGGQFMQRYAMLGKANQWTADGIDYRYVVANPSTFAYLNSYRYGPTGWTSAQPTCHPDSKRLDLLQADDWDNWRYGLRERTGEFSYVGWAVPSTAASLYTYKDVVYLIGENDTGTDYLDMTCPGMAQGLNRKNRAYRFKNHLDIFYPNHHHRLYEIATAGHDPAQIYPSPTGRAVLFR